MVSIESARKAPPHSIEAEMSVLGGLMIENSAWGRLIGNLAESDFYRYDHRVIFHAIGEMIAEAKACDFVTLSEHLRARSKLEAAGGLAALASLAADTHSTANLVHYAGIVRQKSMLRQLIAAGSDLCDMGYKSEGRDAEMLLAEAEGIVESLRQTFGVKSGSTMQPGLIELLQHYTLIYGTDTAYDAQHAMIISVGALRLAAKAKSVPKWLSHPLCKQVKPEQVVFDPSCKAPEGSINLFRGWPLKPKAGSCELLIELLGHLCNEGEQGEMQEWLLNWLAYPLQNPGAKMQTAVIWHGPEGVGKNLFMSALRAIYGEYALEIGQNQIESRFNGWASRKMLVVGNEIIARSELHHIQGQLKQWITEPTWMIEEKNLPTREEANHANFVLFSNSVLPAKLGTDDRRFAVVWTPEPRTAEFYRSVKAELSNGGIEAFYDLLLQRDLTGFGPHSKPPENEAKKELKRVGQDSYLLFLDAWQSGELPVPYQPCATLDLYRAYQFWSRDNGIKNPVPSQMTNAAWKKAMPASGKRKYTIAAGGSERVTEGMVYIPKTFTIGADQGSQKALGFEVMGFADKLKAWKYAHQD